MFQISTNGFYNRFQILNIGYALLQKGQWDWKDISSPFSRLYYVDHGSATVIMPDGEHTLTPGHLYMIPEFIKHSYICGESFGHYYIHFSRENVFRPGTIRNMALPFEVEATPMDVEAVKELLRIIPARSLVKIDPNKYETETVTRSSTSTSSQDNTPLSIFQKMRSMGLLLQLGSRFVEKGRVINEINDPRIINAIGHIYSNITSKMSIEALAQEASLTTDHFIHIFKKETGESPLQFINKTKIHLAQRMLQGADSIKTIAFSLGFDDQAYFERLFRKTTGMSPSAYRRSLRISSY